MNIRSKLLLGLTLAAMLIAGVAWAGSGETGPVPVTVVPVDDAGTVTLGQVEEGLSILAVEPRPGWTVTVEAPLGRQVEARFESDGARVDFSAELEDGEVRLRVERSSSGSSTTSTTATTSTIDVSSTTQPSTTSTQATSSTTGPSTSTSQPGTSSTSSPSTTSTTQATTSSTSSTSTTEGTTSTSLDQAVGSIPDGVKVYDVGSAGAVMIEVRSGRLALAGVKVNSGWSHEVNKSDFDDIRVEFVSDSDAEAEIRVRVRDGRLEVEIRRD